MFTQEQIDNMRAWVEKYWQDAYQEMLKKELESSWKKEDFEKNAKQYQQNNQPKTTQAPVNNNTGASSGSSGWTSWWLKEWQLVNQEPVNNAPANTGTQPTNTQSYTPVQSYQEWIDRWQKPTELIDLVQNAYWVTAEYDPNTNKVLWYDSSWVQTKEWSFDEWWFAVRKDIEAPMNNETFMSDYSKLINSWANQKDINAFLKKNYDFATENKEEVRALYKTFLKNEKIQKTSSRLNWLSGKQLFDEYKQNTFTKWDDVWNALSPEVQAKFDEYYTLNIRKMIRTGEEVVANVTSEDPEEVFAKMSLYNPEYQEKFKEIVLWNEDRKNLQSELSSDYSELVKLQRQYSNIEDKIRKKYPSASESQIEKIARKEAGAIANKIEDLTDSYNVKLNQFNMIDADVQAEFWAYQADAWIDYETYQTSVTTALQTYRTNQAQLNAKELMELEYKQQELTRQKNEEFQWKILEWEKKTADEEWVYQVNRNWELVHIVWTTAKKVTEADWTILATQNNQNYQETLKENSIWWRDIIRTYNDWTLPTMSSFDMYWNLVAWTPATLSQALIWIPSEWLQCWEWVNDYLNNLWITWNVFWDSYEDKKAKINSDVPKVGWIAVWNPSEWQWEDAEYGHVWIITDISSDWETLTITDWNWNWDEKKSTHKVKRSAIESNGWYHIPELPTTQESASMTEADSWVKLIDAWEMTLDEVMSKLWTNETSLRLKNEIVSKVASRWWKIFLKSTDPQVKAVTQLKDTIAWLLDDEAQLNNVTWTIQSWNNNFFTKNKSDYLATINNFLKSQTLQSLIDAKANWATFGALSNEELRMLQDSASELSSWAIYDENGKITWFDLSPDKFKEILKRLYNWYVSSEKLMTWSWIDNIDYSNFD